jgi:hypothetical protein
MMFSATLIVRRIPRPIFKRDDVLLKIKTDIENIRTRSSRKTSSLNMVVRWSATEMLQDGWR